MNKSFLLCVFFVTITNFTGWATSVVTISKSSEFASKVKNAETIYDIQCEVDLKRQTVQMPRGCALRFSSGKIKNGTLIGNNTYIDNPSNREILERVEIGDKAFQFSNDYIYVDWFSGNSDADKVQAAVEFASKNRTPVHFLSRIYTFDHTVIVPIANLVMKGSGGGGEYQEMGTKICTSTKFSSPYENNPLFYVTGEPRKQGQELGVVSGRITGITFTTGRSQDVFHFLLSGAPSRPLFIDHCSFLSCASAIRVLDNGTSTALGFLYVENCTMVGNKWNIVAHGRHSLLGLYFCKNVAEQCDGNINIGYSENYTSKPYDKPALKPIDYAGSANIVICDNLLEGTVDCIYINGGKCVVVIERNYFETSRKQFVVLSFSTPKAMVSFQNNYISSSEDVFLHLKNCRYSLQKNFPTSSLKTSGVSFSQ